MGRPLLDRLYANCSDSVVWSDFHCSAGIWTQMRRGVRGMRHRKIEIQRERKQVHRLNTDVPLLRERGFRFTRLLMTKNWCKNFWIWQKCYTRTDYNVSVMGSTSITPTNSLTKRPGHKLQSDVMNLGSFLCIGSLISCLQYSYTFSVILSDEMNSFQILSNCVGKV